MTQKKSNNFLVVPQGSTKINLIRLALTEKTLWIVTLG
jgi:hypothetical protein